MMDLVERMERVVTAQPSVPSKIYELAAAKL